MEYKDKARELLKQGKTAEEIRRRIPDDDFTEEDIRWLEHPYQSKDKPILPDGFPICKPKRHAEGEWEKGKIVNCIGKFGAFYPEYMYTVLYEDGQKTTRYEEDCIIQAKKYKEIFGSNK